ncbi:MAG TPA: hypothetical protein VIO61_17370 [Anaerolineaceae bacterium]
MISFIWRKWLYIPALLAAVCLVLLAGCGSSAASEAPALLTSVTPARIPTIIPITLTPAIIPTIPPLPTSTASPTSTNFPPCYQEKLSAQMEDTPAIRGWKTFASRANIQLHYFYFPPVCSKEALERDAERIFYGSTVGPDETGLVILNPVYEGKLGDLYHHLAWYDFWQMGPEDYPYILKNDEGIRPNIVVLRVDRLSGDGKVGTNITTMMEGLAEHEYIHTIQAINNPHLAKMIWQNDTYRAFIERYANIGNNSSGRYFRAAPTYVSLLQFLDGLNQQGILEARVVDILQKRGLTINHLPPNSKQPIYGQNLRSFLETSGGKKYIEQLSKGQINPLMLVESAGSGKLEIYKLLQQLYNENIRGYNRWYYGGSKENNLPESFEALFSASSS